MGGLTEEALTDAIVQLRGQMRTVAHELAVGSTRVQLVAERIVRSRESPLFQIVPVVLDPELNEDQWALRPVRVAV